MKLTSALNPYCLVTDFDGTITRHDFYALALEHVSRNGIPDYWSLYATGKITHFEAMRGIFSHIRCPEAALEQVMTDMKPEPELRACIADLKKAGWDVQVVSAGSSWYIERIFARMDVDVTVHASPGDFHPERGLELRLPEGSPFCSDEHGIDKVAVVKDALNRYERVAFAGNGPPDIPPALLVPAELRFAKDYVAIELRKRRQPFRPFERWRDVAYSLTVLK